MSMNKKNLLAPPAVVAPRPLRLRIESSSEDVRIEVVPLIDVIFCILTFFILAAMGLSRQQAISVDLPKAGTGTPQGREILAIALNESGQVFVDQQPVTTKDLFLQKLRDYNKNKPTGIMALYAPTNATYSQVVQVLDLMREVGGDRVALATIPGESPQTFGTTPALPPATGVPGVPIYPGTNSSDPYGIQNPTNQLNPAQPQLPSTPGQPLPGLPGTAPGTLQPLPGQPQNSLGNPALSTPGATVPRSTNNPVPQQTSPGNPAVSSPGAAVPPSTNNAAPQQISPSNSTVPTPGTQVPPNTDNAAPKR